MNWWLASTGAVAAVLLARLFWWLCTVPDAEDVREKEKQA